MHFNIPYAREVPLVTDSNNMLKDIHSCSHYFINIRTEISWIMSQWQVTIILFWERLRDM